jgi:hypothetical protein
MKIVLVLFVVVLLAYAIYYVMSDVNKQKANEHKDKKIMETFEEYDIRKVIRSELDKFKMDSKIKSKIFDSLSGKIDTYKNMSPEDLKDMINAGIADLKKRYGVSPSASPARAKEAYAEEEEEEQEEQEKKEASAEDVDDVEEAYEDDERKLDSISKAFKRTRETFAKEDTFNEPASVPKRSAPKDNSSDIAAILDNTSLSLETVQRNMTKLKNILVATQPSAATAAKPPKATIEGFENLPSHAYAAYF